MKAIQSKKMKTKNTIESTMLDVLKDEGFGSEIEGWIKKSKAENMIFWNVICIKSMRIRDILRI